MSDKEEARLVAEAEEIATRTGDLRSLAMLRMATSARPGPAASRLRAWLAGAEDANRLADESGDLQPAGRDPRGRLLRLPLRRRLRRLRARRSTRCWSWRGDDRSLGAGIVIGSPIAWATMAQGPGAGASAAGSSEAEELFERALRIATEEGDPEMASWTRGNAALMLAMRGEPRRRSRWRGATAS